MKIYNNKDLQNVNFLNNSKTCFIKNDPLKCVNYRDSKRYLKVHKAVESVLNKVKQLHLKKIEMPNNIPAESKVSKVMSITNADKKKSIIYVVCVLIGYGILYTFYSKWKKVNEAKRVQESIEQYERDKNLYIETGQTR